MRTSPYMVAVNLCDPPKLYEQFMIQRNARSDEVRADSKQTPNCRYRADMVTTLNVLYAQSELGFV